MPSACPVNRKDIHALDFHSNGQIPPDDQYALLFILSGGTHRQSSFRAKTLRLQYRGKPSGFNTEGCRGGVALVRAPPPAPVRLDQFGNRARTGGQDEWRVPFVQYPIYDRSCHTSQSAHCNLCGNDQTSTHAVLKWSGVAAALVNPLYLDISRTTMPHRLSV